MKNKIILIASVLSLFLGCNSNKEQNKTTEINNIVKVTLTAIVGKNDSFQLFFKEEDNVEKLYEENNSVWIDVVASDKPQEIQFLLPENVLPNYLRIDLGVNNIHKSMTIKGLNVSYLNKKININGVSFFDNFFIPNDCINIKDKKTGVIKLDKNKNNSYDPILYSGENLKYELQKMFK